VIDQIKNTEEILITIGKWLENTPLSATFSSQDRIMGFAALNDLHRPVPSRISVQHALEQLERLLEMVGGDSKPAHQNLMTLRDLVLHNNNEH
jgi:ABC-type Na+ transport system ATPase subunit NatA